MKRNLAKISKKLRIKWNFELTVFELTVPDLYSLFNTLQRHVPQSVPDREIMRGRVTKRLNPQGSFREPFFPLTFVFREAQD